MKTLVNRYDKKLIGQLPKVLFQGRIIVIQSEQEARKAVQYLLVQDMVGIDTETKPVFKKGQGMAPVALLQVATDDTCFLFRLNHIGLTDDIIRLLSDDNTLKVGLSLKDDFTQLKRRKPFTPGRYVELQDKVREMGIVDQSLQKLYANFFGQRISKTQQLTNWEADVLTEAQKRYAATDAWACIQLLKEISHLDANGYMLDIIPEPEQMPPPLLSEDEQRERKERKEKKKRASRQRKLHDIDNSKRRKRVRKEKEIVKSLDAYESKSHNQNIL